MQPKQIKAIRQAAKMTQQELAAYLGSEHRAIVCRLEKGRREPTGPQRRLLEILAEKHEINISRKSSKSC